MTNEIGKRYMRKWKIAKMFFLAVVLLGLAWLSQEMLYTEPAPSVSYPHEYSNSVSIYYETLPPETTWIRQVDKSWFSDIHPKFCFTCYQNASTYDSLKILLKSDFNSTRTLNLTVRLFNKTYGNVEGVKVTLNSSFFDIQPMQTKTVLLKIRVDENLSIPYEFEDFQYEPFYIQISITVLTAHEGKLQILWNEGVVIHMETTIIRARSCEET